MKCKFLNASGYFDIVEREKDDSSVADTPIGALANSKQNSRMSSKIEKFTSSRGFLGQCW